MTPHAKGLLIAALGVICISPDTLLIRIADADYGTTLFWRGLFTTAGLFLLVVLTNGRNTGRSVRALGRPGLMLIVLFSVSNLAFVLALQHTTVANTLVIVSTAPIFAALLSRLFLHEPVGGRTATAIAIVIAAIAYIFGQNLQGPASWGNLMALVSAVSMAAAFVMTRYAHGTDMTPAMALSSLVSTVIAIPLVASFAITWQALAVFALLGLFLTAAFTLLFIAPRYIPAAEVSLLMPLETVLGTALVWIIVGEQPSLRAVIGGSVIISVLIVNSLMGVRASRRVSSDAPTPQS